MATRNRSKKFFDLRKERKFSGVTRPKGYNKPGITPNELELAENHAPMLPVGAPPEWAGQVDQIHSLMQRIKEKMEDLKERHNQHLLPRFEDTIGEEQRIEILTQDITSMFQDAKKKIKALNTNINQKKLGDNLKASLAQDLQSLSVTFRKYQKDFLQKLQQQQNKKKEYTMQLPIDMEEDEDFQVDVSFTQAQMQKVGMSDSIVRQRQKEIEQIAKSIKELAQIFNDLATLVYEQGTILDRIDYNLEQVETNVEQAVAELGKARTHQKKYTARLCLLLCLCVVLMGIIVALKAIFF